MDGRPGQVRKRRAADLFGMFMRSITDDRRGWTEATPDDVFDWLCYLDTHGGGTKWVHDRLCPRLGLDHGDACPQGGSCGKFHAADSLSKLKMAFKCILFRGDGRKPASRSGNPYTVEARGLVCTSRTRRRPSNKPGCR